MANLYNLKGTVVYIPVFGKDLKIGDTVFCNRKPIQPVKVENLKIDGISNPVVLLSNTETIKLDDMVFKLGIKYLDENNVEQKVEINATLIERFVFQYGNNLIGSEVNFRQLKNGGKALLEVVQTNWEKIVALPLGTKIYIFFNKSLSNTIRGYYYCGIHPAGSKRSLILCDDASINDGLKGVHIDTINANFFTTDYEEAKAEHCKRLKSELEFWSEEAND